MIDTTETLLCRGMRDLLPDEMARFRRVEQAFRDACHAWGYAEIRTPTLEHLYLFTSSGTLSPQLLGRVYSFLDWDGWTGERVVLRPDATIPVARLFRERLDATPLKLAYVENIFRFGASAAPREVWQCGAELIGDAWPSGDAELILMALRVLRTLGLAGPRLTLSHTGVVRALLEHAGFAPDEQAELYDRLLDGDLNVVGDVEARLPDLGPALRLLTGVNVAGAAFLANLRSAFLPAVPGMQAPLDELALIAGAMQAAGVEPQVSVTSVRDFEYYTGPVFHLSLGDAEIAGGGRYDRLIADAAGAPLPACGFALNVDQLLPLVSLPEAALPTPVEVRAASLTAGALAAAAQVAEGLQAAQIAAGLVGGGQPARWTVQVEQRNAYTVHDGRSGRTQAANSVDQVIDLVRGG